MQSGMSTRTKVLFASSEAQPLIKTGGLADVAGSLPKALRRLGCDVRLILPGYPAAFDGCHRIEEKATVSISGAEVRILEAHVRSTGDPVFLVDSPTHFRREGNPYVAPDGKDWSDNAERFATFCSAVAQLAAGPASVGWQPDVVHANDWQSGLIAPLLSGDQKRPATLFTIHNLAYQGVFDAATFRRLDLPKRLWSVGGLEFHGLMSFIKGGIALSDLVTTVSPTYAEEVRTAEFGYGLEGLLQSLGNRFVGVLNGVDYEVWDPAHDSMIAQSFDAMRLDQRVENKLALQRELDLHEDPDAMLFGHIGRLVEQKGVDLILDTLPGIMDHGETQVVILGSGNPHLERRLREVAGHYPGRVGIFLGYDEPLAHRIEAASDCFLMPSRFEPCGLNQLYSLRYGAVPIVRHTGGLADTVIDASAANFAEGRATGFVFHAAAAHALWLTIERAIRFWNERRSDWGRLTMNGMARDFSWDSSAKHYLDLYERARQMRRTA